jgi:hypothetical protein
MSKRNLAVLISAYVLLALIVLTSAKAASHRHSVNIREGHKHPITDCSDLRIQFDERDAVMRSEEKTLTKSEAAVLQVHPHENGGVQVVGWDRDTYSVTACKAAAGSGDAAERILSQITMLHRERQSSTKGPADDDDWTVYLLIRAPKSASIELDTMNGPISLYDVNGKLTARAHNGDQLEEFLRRGGRQGRERPDQRGWQQRERRAFTQRTGYLRFAHGKNMERARSFSRCAKWP